jgi:hypothetical protein
MMVVTQEDEILLVSILMVLVKVCDLAFDHIVAAFEPKAQAASAAALQED